MLLRLENCYWWAAVVTQSRFADCNPGLGEDLGFVRVQQYNCGLQDRCELVVNFAMFASFQSSMYITKLSLDTSTEYILRSAKCPLG